MTRPARSTRRATIDQLARLHDGSLPVGTIRDHPDLPIRAVMIDVSRDKVPTMATLRDLIDRLASWKVNQVQLYSEHTFAYRNHPEVHAAAGPFTPEEIGELDAFCADRFVELVPNQNCLGHMNRWLLHDRYRPLAIAPDGFVDPYGLGHEAMTLDPANPGSLALVRELLGELLPLFSSRRVNIGLDETWELPRERLGEFFEWAATLRALPELDGHEVIIWGDMFSGHPELVAQVPAGVTVCEWGYDAGYPFVERTALLADAGIPFWVAPGTSSWLSIGGRVTNSITNCREAVEAALANGGVGFLNTDWGDRGHLQQVPISDPGFAYGAAVAWCLDANADIDLGAALERARVRRPDRRARRRVAHDRRRAPLGHAADPEPLDPRDALVLPADPRRPRDQPRRHRRGARRGEARAGDGASRGRPRDPGAPTRSSWSKKCAGRSTCSSSRWTTPSRALPATGRSRRSRRISALPSRRDSARSTETHRRLWLARNRPGGLPDSAAWLENLGVAYRTGEVDPEWAGWPAKFS